MTDDELITEFRARLIAGHYGERAFMMPDQENYSGMWAALCRKLPEWEDRFGYDNPVVWEVRTAMHALADERPCPVRIFKTNTTEYGRDELGHA